jgi:hypothetical protein
MDFLNKALNNLTTGTRVAVDVAAWSGHYISRHFNGGLCLVCNNLQPHGHENTWGRVGSRWIDKISDSDGLHALKVSQTSDVATLVLENIPPKDILAAREIDKQTGRPRRNCRYCRLLCDIFDAFFIDEYMSWITETHNAMPIQVGLMIREGLPLIINCWAFTYDKYISLPRVDLEVYNAADLDPGQSSPSVPKLGSVGPRSANAGSESCMSFIQNCVSQCCVEHESCRIQTTGSVPTRLIYLGETSKDLCIHDSVSTTAGIKWAALSHCWGGSTPYKLERANLDNLQRHIDSSDLPATFRDAIEVTRKLGLLYLWIDSLCIIQNDNTDWNIEAARMGMVYGQAFVVICAASSPNPETSFLGPRDKDWLPKRVEMETEQEAKVSLMVRQRSLLAAPFEQGIYEPPFASAWASLKRVGPLYKRGWCFQETFLASRVLHFAPGSIIFECKTHRRCEDQLPPFPSTIPSTLGEVDPASQWRMLVKAYTQRQLTFAKDKLTAIGGAASTMPQAKRSTYLAGLWRESLLLDLLWQVMPGGTHLALTYPKEEQNAPSWSWASVDRGVTWNPLKSPQLIAEVVDAEVVLLHENTYGAVAYGQIVVRGRIMPCQISTNYHRNEQWVYFIKNGVESKKVHFRMDGQLMPVITPTGTETFARRARVDEFTMELQASAVFLCIAKTPWRNYNYVGLVLSKSAEHPGCLERVGNVARVPSDWYESGEPTTVTII